MVKMDALKRRSFFMSEKDNNEQTSEKDDKEQNS